MTQMETRRTTMGTGTLKGHMALNSSPYKPCINKLSSQYIIQDQMASHYYNMATIKSAIDSKQPKSTSLSIKKRDQMRRDVLLKQLKSGKPLKKGRNQTLGASTMASTRRPKSAASGASVMSKSNAAKSPYSTTQAMQNSRPKSADYNSKQYRQKYDQRPATMSSFGSQHEKLSPRNDEITSKMNILDLTYSGDYLDRHESRFKNNEQSLFTPRTKKRPGKSFLSQSPHYAPPSLHPKKKTPKKSTKKPEDQEQITETNLRKLEEPHSNASRDEDHRRWVEEQSEFVQRLSLIEEEEQRRATDRQRRASSRSVSIKSETRRMIDEEEEELKYLEFINEVTNDILTRGIYSDSVLHQMMERHVQRMKGELQVDKMWRLLDKLKRDLGMSERSDPAVTSTHSLNETAAASKYRNDARPHSSKSGRYHNFDETGFGKTRRSAPVPRPRQKTFERAKTPSLASVSSIKTEKSEHRAGYGRRKSEVSDVFEPEPKDDVAELLLSSAEEKPASSTKSALPEKPFVSEMRSTSSTSIFSQTKPSTSDSAPLRPSSVARSSTSEKASISRRSSTSAKEPVFKRPATPIKRPTPSGSMASEKLSDYGKSSTPDAPLSSAESVKSEKLPISDELVMTLGPGSSMKPASRASGSSEGLVDFERPPSPTKSVASEKSLALERVSTPTRSATPEIPETISKRTGSVSSLKSDKPLIVKEASSLKDQSVSETQSVFEELSSSQKPSSEASKKSSTSSVKDEPVTIDDVTSPKLSDELSEDESDYESVIALSTVMKPPEKFQPSGSKINTSAAKRSPSTDPVKDEESAPVDGGADGEEEDNYSDDFESDDNF